MKTHVVLLVGAAACLACASARAGIVIVHVFNFDFSVNPAAQPIVDPIIKVGDTLRFQFDAFGHTATSVTGIPEVFNLSGNLGEFRDHTFTNAGVWWYYCVPHGTDNGNGTASGMSGFVTVQVPAPGGVAVLAAGAATVLRRRR